MQRRSFIKQSGLVGLGLSLGTISCNASHRKNTEILILGAGLSGLYTAMLLEEKGISYKILEGSNRVGGRLFTRDDFSSPTELGGVEIGDGYERVVKTAKQLKVNLKPSPPYAKSWCLHYKGENVSSNDWATTSLNPLSAELKSLAPYRLESYPLRGKIPFENITGWAQEKHKSLDYPYVDFLKNAGYDEETLRLANISANHNGSDKVSTIQIMRSIAYRMMGGSKAVLNIEGGSSRLPEAMAKSLGGDLLLNKKVNKISEDKHGVKVESEDGDIYRADKLICTLPFSVLRNLELNARFTTNQKEAINKLPYTQITIGIVAAKTKFWLEDNLPVSMWTDSPIERVFATNNIESEEVLLKVFINGEGAKKMDQLSQKRARQKITKTFNQIRPSTQGNIEVLDTFSWGNYEFNKGAYAEFHAGQVNKFALEMAKPTDRIFFAGEHTSLDHRGMEGAMASAERVVNELNKRI